MIVKDRDAVDRFATASGTKSARGVATGATIGGLLGAVIAGLTAAGSIVAIAGTAGTAAALAGLGAGGLAGGVIGGLIGLGIREHKPQEYDEGRFRRVFTANRGYDVPAVSGSAAARDTAAFPT